MNIKPAIERQLTVQKSRQNSLGGEMGRISLVPRTKLFWVFLGGSFPSRVLLVVGPYDESTEEPIRAQLFKARLS